MLQLLKRITVFLVVFKVVSAGTVKKCCNTSEYLDLDTLECKQVENSDTESKIDISVFNIIHGRDCKENQTALLLDPNEGNGFQFEINSDGTLIWDEMNYSYIDYCIDDVQGIAVICDYEITEDTIVSVAGILEKIQNSCDKTIRIIYFYITR